jgi:predicted RNA-binding Zn-ribbon protein involved in translation (DUF1610 family)
MEQTEKNTVIASRCPECGAIIADRIDISALQNEEFMVKCKICGKSNLTVRKDYDGKIRLNIPCLVCAHQHPYTLGSSSFFEKELFLLQCSYSGLDICFIGTEDKVDEALRASARQLKELFSENENQETDNNFLDINIMQEVMYAVEELAITNRIRCSCGEPNLAITVEYDKVHISCKDCGDKATLFASEKSDIDTAINLKKLILSRP